MRDLVETALGVVLVASFALAGFILPSVLLDMVAGTDLTGPVATALLVAVSAAAVLVLVAVLQGPHAKDNPRPKPLRGMPDGKGLADPDDAGDWRRR